jgi:hypothetical protein
MGSKFFQCFPAASGAAIKRGHFLFAPCFSSPFTIARKLGVHAKSRHKRCEVCEVIEKEIFSTKIFGRVEKWEMSEKPGQRFEKFSEANGISNTSVGFVRFRTTEHPDSFWGNGGKFEFVRIFRTIRFSSQFLTLLST